MNGTSVCDLRQIEGPSADQAGGKALNLARLGREGFRVPDGFCVLTCALDDFMQTYGLDPADIFRSSHPRRRNQAAADFQERLRQEVMPTTTRQAVIEAYRRLGRRSGESDPVVAVRSSAVDEDSSGMSFAGQYESIMGVRGEDDLIAAIQRCWSSLWRPEALFYRWMRLLDPKAASMAVLVQRMVAAQASGIVFTSDTDDRKGRLMLVNAAWGLGHAVVDGSARADEYRISRRDGGLVESRIAQKDTRSTLGPAGLREVSVPPSMRTRAVLDDRQLRELASLSRRAEDLFGSPQDIEWALDDDGFAILQSRPITAGLAESGSAETPTWTLGNYQAITPLLPMIESLRRLWFRTWAPAAIQAGRPTVTLFRIVDGAIYTREVPVAGSARERRRRELRFQALLESHWQRGTTVWEELLLPEITATNRRLKSFPLAEASNEALAEHWDDLLSQYQRYWFIHWLRGKEAWDYWLEAFERLTGLDDPATALALCAGPHSTRRMMEGLKGLAERLRRSPLLREILEAPESFQSLQSDLLATSEGRTFRRELEAFLETFGYRGSAASAAVPTWKDDPSQVIELIRSLADRQAEAPSGQDQAEGEDADRRLRTVLDRIGPHAGKRRELRRALLIGRKAHAEQEDHHFHLDQTINALIRLTLLEIGNRLVGLRALAQPEDVFFLDIAETQRVLRQPPKMGSQRLVRIIEARQELHRERRKSTPPRLIRPAGGRPDDSNQAELEREATSRLQGTPASPGVVRGRARILAEGQSLGHIGAGEILVAAEVDSSFTPLLPRLAGIVLQRGALLRHAAIVAREYRIPMVIRVPDAVRSISDGQTLIVDGNSGSVRILPE